MAGMSATVTSRSVDKLANPTFGGLPALPNPRHQLLVGLPPVFAEIAG